MMKLLTREVAFGKATARITVTMFAEKKYLDGDLVGEEVVSTSKVEIIANGRVVESGRFADILEYNNLTDTYFRKNKLDVTKKYTRVGDKAVTNGDEAGKLINRSIDEMKEELSKEFDVETEAEKNQKEVIEEAQAIVEQAEKEGIENLLSAEKIKAWRKRYNDMYNEGGEGYVPIKVSREEYEKALEILHRKDVV